MTLPKGESAPLVEVLPIKAGHAQGLLYANNALYVVTNGPGPGLYKCTDADGDGVFEEEKLLRKIDGGGEHGPHQVVLAPDGKSIYVVGGNHTKIPNPEKSLVPRVWQEDHLVPRMWDANGHAKGILAPGGWICRTDFDGKEWTLISMGYRNQYDLAFNLEGEGFTFDADMEWDIGSPWYRPTRICHAVPASEFGWRSGSGKWPTYYLDNLPATVDIGPGSPVGCVFGTGAKFPEKYQRALFALDWTYGTMYAVHLEQDGSSYTGTKEPFITGRPLPLTDAIIHPDGAMYFSIGGRGSQSAVYRVTYAGSESTAPVSAKPLKKEAKWRHELVALLDAAPSADVVEKAWKFIGNKDRFLRFTARSVIENQPINLWQEKALAEDEAVTSSLDALCALCRVGDKALQPKILSALRKVHDQGLRETEALDLLRVYSLCFIRMGKPEDPAVLKSLCEQFEPMFPSPTNAGLGNQLNKEVCELLVFLGSKQIVPKTMQTILTATDDSHEDAPGVDVLKLNEGYAKAIRDMQKTRPNRQQIAFAYALQYATEGWTPDLRRTFFRWFNTALKWRGGNSFIGFLKNMRTQALKNAPEEMRTELDQLAGEMLSVAKELPRAEGPGKPYSVEDVLAIATEDRLKNRDFARGKKMYEAGLCGTCHRMAGEYGGVGPDITGAGSRYTLRDLLENIVNPSKIISDQYESTLVEKLDGSSIVGRILQEDEKVLKLAENPLMPDQVTEVKPADIKARGKYPVSAMPPALLNNLNEEEVLDLLAYILSGGNPGDKSFKKP
jgi:putative heme-binding domain-containing protein